MLGAGVAIAAREEVQPLRLAVLDDLEVVPGEVGDDLVLAIEHGDAEGDQVDAAAKRRLRVERDDARQAISRPRAPSRHPTT